MSLKVWVLVGVAILSGIGIASFVPDPGECNVSVAVTNLELGLLVGTEFQVTGVNPTVSGHATLVDWSGWLPAGFAWATLSGTFTEKVTVGPASTQKTETQLVPSLSSLTGSAVTAQDSYSLAYVPFGQQPVSVTLSENGNVVATGSSSLGVSC